MVVNKIDTQIQSILLLNPYKPCYCSADCIFFGINAEHFAPTHSNEDDVCYGEVIAVEECYIDEKH